MKTKMYFSARWQNYLYRYLRLTLITTSKFSKLKIDNFPAHILKLPSSFSDMKSNVEPDMVAHICNTGTSEANAIEFKSALAT